MFPYQAEKYVREVFKPIPEGLYKVKIEKQKEIENNAKTAKGINISYKILDGEFAERLVFDSFYLDHPNKEFEKSERNRFNGLLEAVKLLSLSSVCEINARPLAIKVKIKKASSDGKFPECNKVADYFDYNYSENKDYSDIPF
jgi:hypothetical protein